MILQVAKRIANIRFDLIMPNRENSLVHVLNNCASHSRYFSDELDAQIFL